MGQKELKRYYVHLPNQCNNSSRKESVDKTKKFTISLRRPDSLLVVSAKTNGSCLGRVVWKTCESKQILIGAKISGDCTWVSGAWLDSAGRHACHGMLHSGLLCPCNMTVMQIRRGNRGCVNRPPFEIIKQWFWASSWPKSCMTLDATRRTCFVACQRIHYTILARILACH